MDEHAVAFLEVMIALAIVGIVSFLILLISGQAARSAPGARPVYQPRWYELFLAAVFLAALAIVVLWWLWPGAVGAADEDTRATTFIVIMLIVGGGAVVLFVISLFWHNFRGDAADTDTESSAPDTAESENLAQHKSPSAIRLAGIIGFFLVFLIFNWSYLESVERHLLMKSLMYPAGFVVSLVMLFDKASRSWDIKAPGESTREWLYVNAMLVLYLIAYVNFLQIAEPSTYSAMFWDVLFVGSFLLVFWIVDRSSLRPRFLLLHAWLIALPILLLIWQSQMGVEAPVDVSWWDTIWPFFVLAAVFFVIELIIQIATDQGSGLGLFKDVVFLALYLILLISVRPQAVA